MTKAQKIAIIGNMHPPVALTGKETSKEIDAIIKSRNNVEAAPTDEDAEPVESKGKAKTAVHFVMKDGKTRSFTPADHGKDFADVADEFHKTNELLVKSRVNE